MPWIRRRYRGNKVYVEVDDAEKYVVDARGLGKMRYKPEDDRTYTVKISEIAMIEPAGARVATSELEDEAEADRASAAEDAPAPVGPDPAESPKRPRKKAAPKVKPASPIKAASNSEDRSAATPISDAPETGNLSQRQISGPDAASDGPGDDIPALAGLAVHAYTDGASLGNPGPSGAGVVLLFREHRKEASVYLGITTNNVAELTAVLEALRLIRKRDLPVRVHSDSTYVIGVLDGRYKPKANRELVAAIHEEMRGFPDLRFIKVEAHVGIEWNERADALAGQAAKHKRSSTTST